MDTPLVLVDGSTFFASDSVGDTSSDEDGLFFGDMRHVSVWRMTSRARRADADLRHPPVLLGAYTRHAAHTGGVNPTVSVRRDRLVAAGVHEDIIVENYGDEDCELLVDWPTAPTSPTCSRSKTRLSSRAACRSTPMATGSCTGIGARGSRGRPRCGSANPPRSASPGRGGTCGGRARHSSTCVDVSCTDKDGSTARGSGTAALGQLKPDMPMTLEQWLADAPTVHTGFDPANHAYRQALLDLAALRFVRSAVWHGRFPPPARRGSWPSSAGTAFITACQALPFQPRLARTTLQALAAVQATGFDDYPDASRGSPARAAPRKAGRAPAKRPNGPYTAPTTRRCCF